MGSKKALRNRGNFRNSKTTNSWNHVEGCLVIGRTALDSMQMASQGALHWGTGALGHWGLTRDDEGYELIGRNGEPE